MESSTASLSSIDSFSHSWNLKPSSSSSESGSRHLQQQLDMTRSSSFDAADEASFIEMDPKMPSSRRFSRVPAIYKDFSFDFRNSPSPLLVADADDLISPDGFLVPLFSAGCKRPMTSTDHDHDDLILDHQAAGTTTTTTTHDDDHIHSGARYYNSLQLVSSLNIIGKEEAAALQYYSSSSSSRVRFSSLRRCKRLSKRILELLIIRPLCNLKLMRGRHRSASSRVASIMSSSNNINIEGKMMMNKAWLGGGFHSPAVLATSSSPSRTSRAAWSADHNWRRSCDSDDSSIYEAVLHCKRTHHHHHGN